MSRIGNRKVSCIMFLVLAATVASKPVAAQTDSRIAYAFISDGASATVGPADYLVNPGGGAVTMVRTGVGAYTVTFAGSTIGTNWNVQATGYGTFTNNYCKTKSWGVTAFGAIDVLCFAPAGAPADSPFTIQAAGSGNLKQIAFSLVDASGAPSSAYTSNPGGAVTGTRNSAGRYSVTFNGLSTNGGVVQATAFGDSNTRCAVSSWGASGSVSIACAAPDGTATDSAYLVSVLPAGPATPGTGYTWADQASSTSYTPTSQYTSNPAGSVTITRSSVGVYLVNFSGLFPTNIGGNVRATAYNADAKIYCKVNNWNVATAGDLTPGVRCFDTTGAPADSRFTLLALAPTLTPLTLTCSPTTGPAATAVAYSSTCTAAGGLPPYVFSLSAPNSLPAGLTLASTGTTATVSGTPLTATPYNYGVTVQDTQFPSKTAQVNFSGVITGGGAGAGPVVSQLAPNSTAAGGAGFNLTVTGSNFAQSAQILWNGSAISTTFSSSTQLIGVVPAALVSTSGVAIVTASQGGAVTNGLTFTIGPAGGVAAGTMLPHIAVNGPYVTSFSVINTSSQAGSFTINFLNDTGQALPIPVVGSGVISSLTGAVPAFGTTRRAMPATC